MLFEVSMNRTERAKRAWPGHMCARFLQLKFYELNNDFARRLQCNFFELMFNPFFAAKQYFDMDTHLEIYCLASSTKLDYRSPGNTVSTVRGHNYTSHVLISDPIILKQTR